MLTRKWKYTMVLFAAALLAGTLIAQPSEVIETESVPIDNAVKVYENVQSAFYQQYSGASNVRWFPSDKDYFVKFTLQGQEHRAMLNRKGKVIYQLTEGTEKHLPADIRRSVKLSYLDYSIQKTFKIKENGRTIWVICMEDSQNFVQVRMEDGELEEVKNFRKQ